MKRLFFLFVLTFFSVNLYAFDYGSGLDPSVMMMEHPNSVQNKSSDQVIDAFQAMFIKTHYLEPVFSKSHSEEEDSFMGMSGAGVYDELMMRALADDLARQDVLKLKELIKEGVYGRSGSKTN